LHTNRVQGLPVEPQSVVAVHCTHCPSTQIRFGAVVHCALVQHVAPTLQVGEVPPGGVQQMPAPCCVEQVAPWALSVVLHVPLALQTAVWQGPAGQSAAVRHATQTPCAVQNGVLPAQGLQATPPMPQWLAVLVWQTPLASQQPLGQLVALHGVTHLPLWQIWPLGQQRFLHGTRLFGQTHVLP
jgi:hypothetical protein